MVSFVFSSGSSCFLKGDNFYTNDDLFMRVITGVVSTMRVQSLTILSSLTQKVNFEIGSLCIFSADVIIFLCTIIGNQFQYFNKITCVDSNITKKSSSVP